MPRDRRSLTARLRGVERSRERGGDVRKALAQIEDAIRRSIALRERRQAAVPKLEGKYDDALPIVQRKDEIAELIRGHQVVILCGETGSGKTTQLPKICLELGRGVSGMIGHTQPRRIAARSVAARIAEELGETVNSKTSVVGTKVRFSDQTHPGTLVKLMTDGILLAETVGDRLLDAYDTLIIDEAHERSLNIDFLLGYIKRTLPKRPDLKVIVTSATIDPERFAEHFADQHGKPAPIINVSGRMYPVEVRYRPIEDPDEDSRDSHFTDALLGAVDELSRVSPSSAGDVLIFLPGERDIRETAEALRKHHPPQTEILPLYARLSAAEQMQVFKPKKGKRRIVLATNVAETSLTVPGIRYVVDPGLARVSRYSPRTRVQRLPIEAISQASADQRKGRCGRVAEGVCIRLYSEEDFEKRPRFTEPEILRTNLAQVILQMKSLDLGEVTDFPFVEPPDGRLIRDGYDTLFELGAVDEAGALTEVGRRLAKLPVDPRVGRMVLAGEQNGCLGDVLVVAAFLSVQDPRERPIDQAPAADEAHGKFKDETSDFTTALKLWAFWRELKDKLSSNQLRKACRTNFLSFVRMREWDDVFKQLHGVMAEMGFHPDKRDAKHASPAQHYEALHKSLLTGMLTGVGMKSDINEYSGVRNLKFSIFPGSGLFKSRPKWVMAAELVKTSRLYARGVAKIEPEWIEQIGLHLVKRVYNEPHWEPKTQNILAFEKVSLFGLDIVPRRKVHFGPVDPKASRELFIHHALVEGELRTTAEFLRHNLAIEDELHVIEQKLRKHDLIADISARFNFYDRRMPQGVFNGSTMNRWLKEIERGGEARHLYMSREDLLVGDASAATAENFPDAWTIAGVEVPLEYHAEPGHLDDGVTVRVPLGVLNQVDPARVEWLVPGMVREKIAELIRTLPKNLRTSFVPAPAWAEKAHAAMLEKSELLDRPLSDALAQTLSRLTGIRVEPGDFQLGQLPPHLTMNIKVIDEHGLVLAHGRDLSAIRRALASRLATAFERIDDPRYNRDDVTTWDFGDLPESVERHKGDMPVVAYPALVPLSGGPARVGLRLMQSKPAASTAMRAGLRRLFRIDAANELKQWRDHLPGFSAMAARYAPIGSAGDLKNDLLELAVDRAYLAVAPGAEHLNTHAHGGQGVGGDPAWMVRTESEFRERVELGWRRLGEAVREVCDEAGKVLAAYHEVAVELAHSLNDAGRGPAWVAAAADVKFQVEHLMPRGFLLSTPPEWLPHLPRYLAGGALRLRKLVGPGAAKAGPADVQATGEIARLWLRYERLVDQIGADEATWRPALTRYRWLIEELRVASYAQELRTPMSVSVKRLDKQWDEVVKEDQAIRESPAI